MGKLDLDTALASCNYYPVQINLCGRVMWFAEIDREAYRRAGFLVPKQARMSEERYGFNLDDVLLHDLTLPIGGAPSHYIFISAFCCSTLLARLLDRVPGCLVLKEPSILGQLAMLRYRPRNPGDGTSPLQSADEWEDEWQTWAALAMRLLTRAFDPGQTVIVKAADVCNAMPEVILANDPRSKAVLLSVGLRTFILSVLKLENRRVWTRKRAAFWRKTLGLFPALSEVSVEDLDDAAQAAYVWLVTAALWNRFQRRTEHVARTSASEVSGFSSGTTAQAADLKDAGPRYLLMDGEEVSENPGGILRKVSAFFGLQLDESRVEEILADPVLSQHAKAPDQTYDGEMRRSDLMDWESRFGAQADRAMEWAATIEEKLEADGVELIGSHCRKELVL